ncbi:hypothetical protein DFH08DRAFT_1074752 [Mycena albidolilacea]|uniref:F-box domain-containing protein n=1 Tax=Mycena albidolilacea TaxID=1033008 RepID=A0AAD7AHN0_9AGAR|nr:hypothetical protein DFH08DRAFT_1074752 [Mycena albidolilacea]
MAAPISARQIFLEETARTRRSSKKEMKEFIKESESKITSLDSQIAALVERRERERSVLASLQCISAPIRTVPVELLAEIFTLIMREEAQHLSHFKQAFWLSHVCAHWREVANTIPRLWIGPIVVANPRILPMAEDASIDVMQNWLSRSAPLSVPVLITIRRRQDETSDIPLVLEELLRISHRWGSLHIRGSPPPALLRRLVEQGKDSLEGLFLSNLDGPPYILSLNTTPRHRQVSILGTTLLEMPWAQLTDLTLNISDDPSSILAQCTHLITASLVVHAVLTVLTQRSTSTFTLYHLRSLFLCHVGSSEFFMHRLCAPALENLHVGQAKWTEARFAAFLLRSPNITQLEISRSHLTPDALRVILTYTPSLTHLSLTDHPHLETLLNALRYEEGTIPLVPHLHNLVLRCSSPGQDLRTTIASRWWTDTELVSLSSPPAVARWTSVQVKSWSHGAVERFAKTMADMVHQGLNFSISFA